MKLSIIVPGIRVENWQRLYHSVDIKDEWEMIFIGPTAPVFWDKRMVYIPSFRSPNACQQMGLLQAKGEYITWAADDGVFFPGALEDAFNHILFSTESDLIDKKTILVGKYFEGIHPNPDMAKGDYYKFKYHEAYRLKGIPQEALIFNCGIISRRFMLDLGGWDAENFECTTVAHADLGIRAHKEGSKMFLMDSLMFRCSHQPGCTGDHAPVHRAMQRDLRRLKEIYADNPRIIINIKNWELTPEKWEERFGK